MDAMNRKYVVSSAFLLFILDIFIWPGATWCNAATAYGP